MSITLTAEDLSITLDDGRVLKASTTIGLARQWAEAEHGQEWDTLTLNQQNVEIAAAFDALNRAAQAR